MPSVVLGTRTRRRAGTRAGTRTGARKHLNRYPEICSYRELLFSIFILSISVVGKCGASVEKI